MNKSFKTLIIAVAGLFVLSGCQKDNGETTTPEQGKMIELSFSGIKPNAANETRTEFVDGAVLWNKSGEAIRVAYTIDGEWVPNNATGSAGSGLFLSSGASVSDDRTTATFTVPTSYFDLTIPGNAFDFYALYPGSITSGTRVPLAPSVEVTFPAVQSPLSTSFDAKADLMIAKSVQTYTEIPTGGEAVHLMWNRLSAIGCVTLSNLAFETGETIKSIAFTAPSGVAVAGNLTFDFETQAVTHTTASANKLTLNYSDVSLGVDGNFAAWFCSVPFTVESGKPLAVEVKTSRGTYTRTITARAEGIHFKQNHHNTLAINMTDANFEANVVDDSIFTIPFGNATANTTYSTSFNMLATGSSASTLTFAFTETSNQIRSSNYIGGYEGASEGSYWWATANSSFTVSNVNISNEQFFTLSFGGGYANSKIQAFISFNGVLFYPVSAAGVSVTGTSTSRVGTLYTMNFSLPAADRTNCSIRLTNTGSTTVVIDDVKLVALDAAGDNSYALTYSPVIQITSDPSVTLEKEGDDVTVTYTIDDPVDGGTLTASVVDNLDWITSLDYTTVDGKVSFTVSANTGAAPRSATITLSYPGAESKNVIITQNGSVKVWVVVDKIANLSAGTYYLGGSLLGNNQSGVPNTANDYALWNGTVSGATPTVNSDLNTVNYKLISGDLTGTGAVEVDLVSSGNTNGYYIKVGNQYLYSAVNATSRRLQLSATPQEWIFANRTNNTGLEPKNNGVTLQTPNNTTSAHIRAYTALQNDGTTGRGIVLFKQQ